MKLGELEAEIIEMNANNEQLQCTYAELSEYKLVLQKVCITWGIVDGLALCCTHPALGPPPPPNPPPKPKT